ncbi:MAG: T9SS type A sorting domain-containing protein [Flavipsychrobacter sp.]
MKKLLLVAASILFATFSNAQAPWLKDFTNTNRPVKLQDIVDAWKSDPEHLSNNEAEEAEEEGEAEVNYQFNRWLWYWQQHTDSNGYLVSPVKTVREWLKYKAHLQRANQASKKTGSAIWTFQGPAKFNGGGNGLGRMTAIGFHPTDTNTFWVGTAGGGAWKTTDNGTTWACMTDKNLPTTGISDIIINPLNPNSIYLLTGDRDGNGSVSFSNYSYGIIKSNDGGASWDTTGITWQDSSKIVANSLVMNPKDTSMLLMATVNGIFKSTDAAKTWTKVLTGNFMQLLYHPTDTNIIYAAGGPLVGNYTVYRSTDGGNTWTAANGFSSAIRISIAVTADNPSIVKAVASDGTYGLRGIYSSSDTGQNFTRIYDADAGCQYNILSFDPKLTTSSCKGQGWYDLCIAVSPTDSNSVFVGGVNMWHSADGGKSWSIINQWTNSISSIQVVHADKHVLKYNPLNPHVLYECNDGGIYKSDPDIFTTWTNITNGLGITQFYRIAVAGDTNLVLGGAQDNGSKGIADTVLTQPGGADGMTCAIDYSNPSIFYTSIYYGTITKHNGSLSKNLNFPGSPSGAWVTPFVLSPFDPQTIYVGFGKLYQSTDGGSSWNVFSNIFPNNIDRIALSYTPDYIYVLAANSIWYSSDGGTTWTRILNTLGGMVSDITVDPKDETHLWATFSGFTTNRVGDYSTKTKKWTKQSGSLPILPVNCITIDTNNNTIYIGTDVGVMYREPSMTDWAIYGAELPVVQVNDLKLNYTTDELWAGTFGRGMWKTARDITPTGISVVPLANNVLNVFPNPNKGSFTINTNHTDLINKQVNVRLINDLGQMVWQAATAFDASGNLRINTSGIAQGTYTLEVTHNSMMARTRIVILQ